jgi:hypothetical protein
MDIPSLSAQLLDAMKKLQRLNLTEKTRQSLLARAADLLARGADPNQELKQQGPLLAIAIHGTRCAEEIKLLDAFLKSGADPNADTKGFDWRLGDRKLVLSRPVHVAVESLQPWVAQAVLPVLTGAGADINAPTPEGWTVLDLAFYQLWGWELEFDTQCLASENSFLLDFRLASLFVFHLAPYIELLDSIMRAGAEPGVWSRELVINCRFRMEEIYRLCVEARKEGFDRAEAANVDSDVFLSGAHPLNEMGGPSLLRTRQLSLEPTASLSDLLNPNEAPTFVGYI